MEFEKSFAPKIQDDADNLARMGTQYKTEAARGRAEAIWGRYKFYPVYILKGKKFCMKAEAFFALGNFVVRFLGSFKIT